MSDEGSSTPLGRVRALGSAQHGGGHWLRERLTSAALLLLGTWFIASLIMLPALDHRTVSEWLRSTAGAVPMALFVIAAFKHSLDGVKVLVDDYVHDEGNLVATHFLLKLLAIAGAALSLFALAKIAFGATAA